jgi:protein-tyrosine phosphatase
MGKMIEIIDRLYIGPCSDRFKKSHMKDIDIIVQCLKDDLEDNNEIENDKIIYVIPVDDTSLMDNQQIFINKSTEYLSSVLEHYKSNKRIFVHCSQGVQRSASFMCYLLMYINDISLEDAIKLVLSKKPDCFSHGRQINFMEALKFLEKIKQC